MPLVLGGEVKNRVDKKSGIEVSGDIEVGGDSVDLIRLFELHARVVFEVAHTLVTSAGPS